MRRAGRVKTWHADKGFGFIDVHADTNDVFFHITAPQTRAVTPTPGDRVSFELGKGRDGRKR
ncbi:cold-shock protein [Cupriavidus necator]